MAAQGAVVESDVASVLAVQAVAYDEPGLVGLDGVLFGGGDEGVAVDAGGVWVSFVRVIAVAVIVRDFDVAGHGVSEWETVRWTDGVGLAEHEDFDGFGVGGDADSGDGAGGDIFVVFFAGCEGDG